MINFVCVSLRIGKWHRKKNLKLCCIKYKINEFLLVFNFLSATINLLENLVSDGLFIKEFHIENYFVEI